MKAFSAGCVLWAGISLALAQSVFAATKVESIEGITEYKLDNGLQILLYPDVSKPTVTVNLTVFVGSRHEGYGETGMAHLLEHMLFKGTPTHTHIPKALQEHGAKYNGTTSNDRTNYYETMPAGDENLEFGLALEADRMINSNVAREDLISEMTVVRNEFERGENSPGNILYQRLLATAYEWHNYGKVTIGNRADIEKVPIEKLKDFYAKYYQPDNALLIVAGRFDEDKTLKMIEKYFGSIPKPKRKLPKTYTEEPSQDGEREVWLRRVGDVGLVGSMYHIPAGAHPDIAPLDILAEVLGNAPSGRLYKALVEPHKATSVVTDVGSWHDPGVCAVFAEVRQGDSLDGALSTLLEVTEAAGGKPVSDEEVDRARQKILKQRELTAADTSAFAIDLSNWASLGDWRLYFLYRDRIDKVEAKDVQDVAAKYLMRSNRTSGMFVPTEKPDRSTIPPSPDLAGLFKDFKGRAEVSAGEAFDPTPKNIDDRSMRETLGKGIRAVLLHKKTRGQTVNLRLQLRYGNLENLKKYQAATDLLPILMTRGTKQLSRQQLQDQLDKNVATLISSGETGSALFSIETKRANLGAVLELLRQIIREPALSKEEFQILQQESLANLEEQLTDPQSLGIVRLRRTLNPYSKDDVRYIPTPQEEVADTTALKVEDLRKLHIEFLGGQAGELSVVGDFEVDETVNQLKKMFAGWTAKQSYERIPKIVFNNVKGSRQEILTPDKANAVYFAGELFAMNDTDPDYPALVLGNFLFGGSTLSARLGDRVRQKEGLSYGVGSKFAAESLDRRAGLTMYAIYNPENVQKVESAISEELARLLKDGVPQDELDRAKKGYLQQQEVERSNDSHLAAQLTDTLYVGRTMLYYADLDEKVKNLTPESLQKAIKKYLDPKRLVVVVAGDFKKDDK